MKTFKTPKRAMPIASEITPEGRLILAYDNTHEVSMRFYEWDNNQNEWSFSEPVASVMGNETACKMRPLHIIKKFQDAKTEAEIMFDGDLFTLNLLDGSVRGEMRHKLGTWSIPVPLTFTAAPFGMMLTEQTNDAGTRVNIYTAEYDWATHKPGKIGTLLNFTKFGYFANCNIGFNTDPKKAVVATNLNMKEVKAELMTLRGDGKLDAIVLPLPRYYRMVSAFPNGNKVIALIGEKSKGTGKVVRFYNENGAVETDFELPFRGHSMHLSNDGLTLSVIGHSQVIQIDLD